MKRPIVLIVAALSFLLSARAMSQQAPDGATTKPDAWSASIDPTTQPIKASIAVGGKKYSYDAKASFITSRDATGKPQGKFFHTSYVLDEPGIDKSKRPVTFVFNGGPGSSSIWLHLGAGGPRKVVVADDGIPVGPPGKLEDNVDSWLPATDLVFIDPIGTGFSRPYEGIDPKMFWSVEGDVASIAEFIRLWLVRNERWESPKFLAGESYGTTRAAGLSSYLSSSLGIDLNGIILISAYLEAQNYDYNPGNDLPLSLYIPSYTASAYVHKKLPADLQKNTIEQALKESETFAMGEYAQALALGGGIPAEKKKDIAAKLSRLIGIPAAEIERNDLHILPHRFQKMLLADQRRYLGVYDAAITGYDADPGAEWHESDPSTSFYRGAYTSAFNHYLRAELKFESDQPYDVMGQLNWRWPEGAQVNTASSLAAAMVQTPRLRVMVCGGYYDLRTPYFATEYTLVRLQISPENRQNLFSRHYAGGHMMYHHPDARHQLTTDIANFITNGKP